MKQTSQKGNVLPIILIILAIIAGAYFIIGGDTIKSWFNSSEEQAPIEEENTDEEQSNGGTSNSTEVTDLIKVTAPTPGAIITSPVTITGQARGNWYFEASFPVKLIDANGNNVPLEPGYIMATGDWMTTEFVPFTASLTFTAPATATGTLVLMKDNPSGLPENDNSISIPVRFK